MRRFNAVISMVILLLFVFHAIAGGFQLAGVMPGGNVIMQASAWVMTALVAIHALIGIKLTADSLKVWKKTGVHYYRENRLFWVRRISGGAVMVFILLHVVQFMGGGEPVRLRFFGSLQLLGQILLVISVAAHVLCNIKPLMISFGIRSFKVFVLDIILILSAVLLLAGAGFVIYYLRWRLGGI